ncbi:hypothetical protein L915_00728 [Phytophthora nicotianae]|nr:hypothetical protein L915_00728 [Phytophthora nicotianae]
MWHGVDRENDTMVELVKFLGGSRDTSVEARLIAEKQLTVRQYCAAAERNWSAHKFVHSQVRNRLRNASVENLVFLFFNAKNFDDDDMAFYDMLEDMAANSSDEENSNEDSDCEYY